MKKCLVLFLMVISVNSFASKSSSVALKIECLNKNLFENRWYAGDFWIRENSLKKIVKNCLGDEFEQAFSGFGSRYEISCLSIIKGSEKSALNSPRDFVDNILNQCW